MRDVISSQLADVCLWVVLDVHKFSIVAAALPPVGGRPEVKQIETTRVAVRRLVDRLGGPEGLAVCFEAGPGGFALLRVLRELGVACDVIAPSLIPVRSGDRIKTDRRDAKKLVWLYRAGELSFVQPPSPETEGLRDLMRCRDDLRCARTAARHRVLEQLLFHGRVYRDGKKHWTLRDRQWVACQRLEDPLAQLAREQMLVHLDGLDRKIDALDRDLEHVARSERWAPVTIALRSFKGVSTLTALGLIAEIGDFARFAHPRELCSWLGIVPSEYSAGQERHRGHITKTGNRHARRLLIEAAWNYRYQPRRNERDPGSDPGPWQAQIRLHRRYRNLTANGNAPTSSPSPKPRELAGFLWAKPAIRCEEVITGASVSESPSGTLAIHRAISQ